MTIIKFKKKLFKISFLFSSFTHSGTREHAMPNLMVLDGLTCKLSKQGENYNGGGEGGPGGNKGGGMRS